jgi:DNA-binding NarL/FixJ family response regulator
LDREPDLTVVAQAGSLAEARGMLGAADVAVVDLGLPDGFGGDLIPELHGVNPRARALVLSASVDPAQIAGAAGSGDAGQSISDRNGPPRFFARGAACRAPSAVVSVLDAQG